MVGFGHDGEVKCRDGLGKFATLGGFLRVAPCGVGRVEVAKYHQRVFPWPGKSDRIMKEALEIVMLGLLRGAVYVKNE